MENKCFIPPSCVNDTPMRNSTYMRTDQFEYEIKGSTIELVTYLSRNPIVQIPAVIDNIPVTTIQYRVFKSCSYITEINIPASITAMGEWTGWFHCKNLTDINVSPINPSFSSVDGVLFNKNQTILIQYPINKFNPTYIIPDSVNWVYEGAFADARNLVKITLSPNITFITFCEFSNCKSLTEVIIPGVVHTIMSHAFTECVSLTDIKLPDSIIRIFYNAFWNVRGLTTITIPNQVTTIEFSTFEGCVNLTTVNIPDSVNKIEKNAFKGCSRLNSITIPKDCVVEDNAFGLETEIIWK